nr:flippase [uncultured Faecalimonas sp.]
MKERSVKFNFIMNFIFSVSQFLFPMITFPYVSRVLRPEGNGSIAFATSVISYFTMIAMLGIPTYGIRACAQVRDDKEKLSRTVHELLLINFVMSLVCYIAFGISMFTVERFQRDKLLLVISSAAILLNVIGVSWLYAALEQYAYITVVAILFKVIAIGMMFMFVHTKDDYIIYGAITMFASGGSYILNFLRLRKFIYFRPLGNYEFRKHLKPILVFFAMSVATSIYANLDKVMLGFLKTDADTGYYDAAVKTKNILVSLVTSLGTVLLPRLSFYIETGKVEEFKKMISKALHFVLLISLPVSIYFIFFAKESILLLSGEAYMGAVMPMCIITPTVILIGITNVLGIQVLVPTGREDKVLKSVAAGAVTDLILNLIYIPRYAASGAAMGTLIAEVVVLIVQVCYLSKLLNEIKKEIHGGKIAGAAVAATFVILILKDKLLFESPFCILASSSLIFFGVYAGMLMLLREELAVEALKIITKKIKQ